jgi:hypothetical protein
MNHWESTVFRIPEASAPMGFFLEPRRTQNTTSFED